MDSTHNTCWFVGLTSGSRQMQAAQGYRIRGLGIMHGLLVVGTMCFYLVVTGKVNTIVEQT